MEIVLAIIVMGLLIAGMAIGVLMGRPPISGSCGGVGKALGESDYTCDICGDDPNKCEEQSGAALGYDASLSR
jgi:hypothetical protein